MGKPCKGKKPAAHNDHGHGALKQMTVMLEEEHVDALKELSKEYSEMLGQRWSVSAVLRLAVGDFMTKIGKIT